MSRHKVLTPGEVATIRRALENEASTQGFDRCPMELLSISAYLGNAMREAGGGPLVLEATPAYGLGPLVDVAPEVQVAA